MSSQDATAPVINVIQIEPHQQIFSTPPLVSQIKTKKVDISTQLKTPSPISNNIKTQNKTKIKTNTKKKVTLSSQEAMKPGTFLLSDISIDNSEDSITTYQCPLSPCPLLQCPLDPLPAPPPPLSVPISPEISNYILPTSNPPPSPHAHQLSPPPHTSSPHHNQPSPSINTEITCSTRRSKRLKDKQPVYKDLTLSDEESSPEKDNNKDKSFCQDPKSKQKNKDPPPPPTEPKTKRKTKVLKTTLLPINKCHLIANQYRRAVYSHDTVESKMQAVQAVLWHNLDHPDATIEQRHTYHQYCTSPCPYIQWITAKKSANDYVRDVKHRDLHDNAKTWTGGYLKKLDTTYPNAFIKLQTLFKTLGSEQLMQRCMSSYSQNMNESMHSKLWRMVLKFKSHSTKRYIFACRMLILVHNFGHEKSSILYVIDMMTQSSYNYLVQKDNDSLRNSKKEHMLAEKGVRKHRKKYVKYDYCEYTMQPLKKHKPPDIIIPEASKAVDEKYKSGCEPIFVGSKSNSKSTTKGCTNNIRTSCSNKASSANVPSDANKPSTSAKCDNIFNIFYPTFVPNNANKRSRSPSSNSSSSGVKKTK